jgi:hypothetical protein
MSATASPMRVAIQRTPVSLSSNWNLFLAGTIGARTGAAAFSRDDPISAASAGEEVA